MAAETVEIILQGVDNATPALRPSPAASRKLATNRKN